ncbi:MAG: translation initiation factor IF-3 [Proteobacteria bacterium]|nr:translation initiation factor IF-3 [Pseudomonadota bacterium]
MRRRQTGPGVPGEENQYRINHQIRIAQILVIGPEGDKLGVMSPDEARSIAAEHGLDLVEVAPNAKPPVCRIMDFGKFRYEQAKKAASSKAAKVDLKELRLRPKTDDHDMETMVRKAKGFIAHGDRVRLVMRLRGREQSHAELWLDKMVEIINMFSDCASVAQPAKVEGKMITATIEPMSNAEKDKADKAAKTAEKADKPAEKADKPADKADKPAEKK